MRGASTRCKSGSYGQGELPTRQALNRVLDLDAGAVGRRRMYGDPLVEIILLSDQDHARLELHAEAVDLDEARVLLKWHARLDPDLA